MDLVDTSIFDSQEMKNVKFDYNDNLTYFVREENCL